jgi:hypothetical protein
MRTPEYAAKHFTAPIGTNEADINNLSPADVANSPISQGFKRSFFGSQELANLTPEARDSAIAAQNQIAQQSDKATDQKSFFPKVATKLEQALGGMAGSPMSYMLPFSGGAIGGAGKIAKVLGLGGIGAEQGVENAIVGKRYGEDTNIAVEAGKAAIPMLAGGIVAAPLMKAAEMIPGNPIPKASQKIAEVLGLSTGMTAGQEPFKEKPFSFSDRGADVMANALLSAPTVASGLLDKKTFQKPTDMNPHTPPDIKSIAPIANMKGVDEPTVKEMVNISKATMPAQEKPYTIVDPQGKVISTNEKTPSSKSLSPDGAPRGIVDSFGDRLVSPTENVKSILDDLPTVKPGDEFKQSLAKTNTEDNVFKKAFMAVGEKFGDSSFKALFKLWRLSSAEVKGIAADKGIPLREAWYEINKGELDAPITRDLADKIRFIPTDEQISVHNANKALNDIMEYNNFKGQINDDRAIYITAKNLMNIVERKASQGKKYILPEGMSLEQISNIVSKYESNPAYAPILESANKIFKANKDIIEKLHDAGVLSDEQHRAIIDAGDNIGIEHIVPGDPYSGSGQRRKQSVSGTDPIKYLEDGAPYPVNMDIAAVLHRRIIISDRAIAKNAIARDIYLMAAKGSPIARPLEQGKAPNAGEAIIIARLKGPDGNIIEARTAVPEWLKKSMENSPIGGKAVTALSYVTGSAPVRALAVGYNPIWGVFNAARDFGRYFRLGGAMEQPESLSPLGIAKTIAKNNPGKFIIDYVPNVIGAIKDTWTHSGKWEEAMQNRAFRGRMTMDVANDPYVGTMTRAKQKVQGAMGFFGAFTEDLQRTAMYKMALKKGFPPEQAGKIVGDMLDYNRAGELAKVVDAIQPFMNVSVQAPRADIKVALQNPTAYAARVGWMLLAGGVSAYTGLKTAKGEDPDSMLNVVQRVNALRFNLGKYKDKFIELGYPLEQQDRVAALIGGQMVRLKYGYKLDTEGVLQTVMDIIPYANFLSKPLTASQDAFNAVVNNVNMNSYTKEPLSFVPVPPKNARHEAYDVDKDSKILIDLAQIFWKRFNIDVQPAMLEYGIKTILPPTLVTEPIRYANALQKPDHEWYDAPVLRRLIVPTNPDKPWRDQAQTFETETYKEKIDISRKEKEAAKIKDGQEYLSYMIKWAQSDLTHADQIVSAAKQGYFDRITGVDTKFKNYLQSKVDPSYYPQIAETYESKKGNNPLDKAPKMKKRIIKSNALERLNDNSEQK